MNSYLEPYFKYSLIALIATCLTIAVETRRRGPAQMRWKIKTAFCALLLWIASALCLERFTTPNPKTDTQAFWTHDASLLLFVILVPLYARLLYRLLILSDEQLKKEWKIKRDTERQGITFWSLFTKKSRLEDMSDN